MAGIEAKLAAVRADIDAASTAVAEETERLARVTTAQPAHSDAAADDDLEAFMTANEGTRASTALAVCVVERSFAAGILCLCVSLLCADVSCVLWCDMRCSAVCRYSLSHRGWRSTDKRKPVCGSCWPSHSLLCQASRRDSPL